MRADNIFLIGMMGSGKSAVGKSLLEVLPGYKFVDIDSKIEIEQNIKISDIFINKGESAFRKIETEMCKKISKKVRQVVATGGGIILDSENVKCMKTRGFVYWLYADNETLFNRIKDETHRPLINTSKNKLDVLDTITTIMNNRFNLYRDCADMIINTSKLTIEECRDIIVNEHERLIRCLN